MLPKNCGQLLYNAVRETLETMAFAEVIPCSIKVGDEEFAQDDDFAVGHESAANTSTESGWGDAEAPSDPKDSWGTVTPPPAPEASAANDSWGAAPDDNAWGTPLATKPLVTEPLVTEPLVTEPAADDGWGEPAAAIGRDDDAPWGSSGIIAPPKSDPWNDSGILVNQAVAKPQEADFDNMVVVQTDWCWACMKVNSPDVHSVWFIVSKGLANALAQNMYAGENFQLDNPLIRDLIAELTNVFGGRLMLLLEELGGKFTLTVPEIGFGMPDVPEQGYETAVCKVVVDGEYPVMAVLCFNPTGTLSAEN